MSSNQGRLDGFSIESHAGRFSGLFDIEEKIGVGLALGDEVLTICVSRMKPPSFKEDKEGDLKRIHNFAPSEAWVITDATLWQKVLDLIEAEQPQGRLFARVEDDLEAEEASEWLETVTRSISRDTGEIRNGLSPDESRMLAEIDAQVQ